jgi:acyl-CoA synthetase (AMP-forming)/AMP-acid ligase II
MTRVQRIRSGQITPAGKRISATAGEHAKAVRSALEGSKIGAGQRVGVSLWLSISIGLAIVALMVAGIVHWLVRDINLLLRKVAGEKRLPAHDVEQSALQVQNASESLSRAATDQAAVAAGDFGVEPGSECDFAPACRQ